MLRTVHMMRSYGEWSHVRDQSVTTTPYDLTLPGGDQKRVGMEITEVAMPSGVARLPRDNRGYPLPAHVGHEQGKPPRITEQDINRTLMLTVLRRCTICGWLIGSNELSWFHSIPSTVAAVRRSGSAGWDPSPLEGVGHEECMVYATVVCPWLNDPDFVRRAEQRGGRIERPQPKGTKNNEKLILVSSADVRVDIAHQRVVARGGSLVSHAFKSGDDLLGVLKKLVVRGRTPVGNDDAFQSWVCSEAATPVVKQALLQYAFAYGAVVDLDLGHGVSRTEPCPCGSGLKFGACCVPRAAAVRELPIVADAPVPRLLTLDEARITLPVSA